MNISCCNWLQTCGSTRRELRSIHLDFRVNCISHGSLNIIQTYLHLQMMIMGAILWRLAWNVPCIELLPRVHAQGVKQSVLSVVSTKITRSWDLGIRATRKHNESVEFGKKRNKKKLASVCSKMFGTAHESHKECVCWPHLSTAPTALPAMCFLLMRTSTTGLVWVGKGRQQIHDSAARSQIDADAARGVYMCSREL